MPTLTAPSPQIKPAEFMEQTIRRFEQEASGVIVGEELMFKANTSLSRSFILVASRYDELVGAAKRRAQDLGFRCLRVHGDEFRFVRLELPAHT